LIQWVAAFGLMALLVGVSLSLIFDNLPWNLIDKTRPGHKGIGIVVIIILAIHWSGSAEHPVSCYLEGSENRPLFEYGRVLIGAGR